MYTVYSEPAAGRRAMRSVTRYTVRMYGCTDKLQLERTVQTVKDYVMAHDSSPFLVLLWFLASLAELISEMWLRVFKYKWNMF